MGHRIRATASRSDPGSYTHQITIRNHRLTADEPRDRGGGDLGPTPQELLAASLASCVAMTIEMYAERKGWELGEVSVAAEFAAGERGAPTNFRLEVELPANCTDEQRRRIEVIATKCPVHRLLEGGASFTQQVTVAQRPAA